VKVRKFIDDDQGYEAWTASHPNGYVINIQRSLNPADGRLHRASCLTINGRPARGRTWTGEWIKVCSSSAQDLEIWAHTNVSHSIRRCGTCSPVA